MAGRGLRPRRRDLRRGRRRYHAHFGERLVRRARIGPGGRVLDVAWVGVPRSSRRRVRWGQRGRQSASTCRRRWSSSPATHCETPTYLAWSRSGTPETALRGRQVRPGAVRLRRVLPAPPRDRRPRAPPSSHRRGSDRPVHLGRRRSPVGLGAPGRPSRCPGRPSRCPTHSPVARSTASPARPSGSTSATRSRSLWRSAAAASPAGAPHGSCCRATTTSPTRWPVRP